MQRGACGCACGGGAGGEVREELEVPWLDLEKSRGQDHMAVAPTVTADAMTEATRADAQHVKIGKAASKAMKCIFRGLIVLLWVYLIDLMRRYVATHSVEELFFTMLPLGILAAAVSMIFCFLMGSIDRCIPPIISPP
ncbi:hypothetical protein SETIT_8G062700v2 [Setaria italica]|uniref:Uncharacterized protein n=1 Tax=Setaria italica TaxID=4555 RepID=A0A368S4Q8_SETIT|nr:hypothetical protein SETIT_8G062700v2 [Setaria italica]